MRHLFLGVSRITTEMVLMHSKGPNAKNVEEAKREILSMSRNPFLSAVQGHHAYVGQRLPERSREPLVRRRQHTAALACSA